MSHSSSMMVPVAETRTLTFLFNGKSTKSLQQTLNLGYQPFESLGVPSTFLHFVSTLDVAIRRVFTSHIVNVVADLVCASIEATPTGVGCERILVRVCCTTLESV